MKMQANESAVGIKETAGQRGVRNTTNTTAVTGEFTLLQCLTDTVFASLTEPAATGQSITGVTLPSGTILAGLFTGYTLTSGTVRAYV